ALFYTAGGGVATILATGWAIAFCPAHPRLAACVLSVASIVWLIANRRWRYSLVNYEALVILFGGLYFATGEWLLDLPRSRVCLWSLLVHASFAVALAAVLDFFTTPAREWFRPVYVVPMRTSALCGSTLAACLLLMPVAPASLAEVALASAWLAAIWL